MSEQKNHMNDIILNELSTLNINELHNSINDILKYNMDNIDDEFTKLYSFDTMNLDTFDILKVNMDDYNKIYYGLMRAFSKSTQIMIEQDIRRNEYINIIRSLQKHYHKSIGNLKDSENNRKEDIISSSDTEKKEEEVKKINKKKGVSTKTSKSVCEENAKLQAEPEIKKVITDDYEDIVENKTTKIKKRSNKSKSVDESISSNNLHADDEKKLSSQKFESSLDFQTFSETKNEQTNDMNLSSDEIEKTSSTNFFEHNKEKMLNKSEKKNDPELIQNDSINEFNDEIKQIMKEMEMSDKKPETAKTKQKKTKNEIISSKNLHANSEKGLLVFDEIQDNIEISNETELDVKNKKKSQTDVETKKGKKKIIDNETNDEDQKVSLESTFGETKQKMKGKKKVEEFNEEIKQKTKGKKKVEETVGCEIKSKQKTKKEDVIEMEQNESNESNDKKIKKKKEKKEK